MQEYDELLPPDGWVLINLADVCEIERGITFPGSVKCSQGNESTIACLRTTNVQDTVVWGDLIYVPKFYVKNENKLLRQNDILISMANSRELVGKVSFVDCIPVEESTFGGFISAIRSSEGLHPRFLFYYLRLGSVREKLRITASQTVNIANLSLGDIYSTTIPIAPLAEQRRIVSALRKAQAKLKRYHAAVLKVAVEGKLTEAWRAEHATIEPASMLLERILKERRAKWEADLRAKGKDPTKVKYVEPAKPDMEGLPKLPEGWCWATLGQIAIFQNGRSFPSKEYTTEGVKLLRPGNMYADGTVRWTTSNKRCLPEVWAERNKDLIVRGCELVMNLTAQSLKDEFLGRVCITDSDEYCLLNQRLARITPLKSRGSLYALYMLKSNVFRQFVNGLNTGSLIQHMFTSQLEGFRFPLPPITEQEQIVAEVEQRLSVVNKLEATIEANLKRAERLRQSILKEAFAGRLVPQDPNDESASVLLERIRKEREGRKKGIVGNGRYVEVSSEPVEIDVEEAIQVELWEGVGG